MKTASNYTRKGTKDILTRDYFKIISTIDFTAKAKMYVHLQPGQETFLIFKLRLEKCTRDDIMYESWNNIFEKEIRWIDILHFGAHDNENHSAKNRCTDKLINNPRISNASIKTIIGKNSCCFSSFLVKLF